jgi:predicted transcriptional regulator
MDFNSFFAMGLIAITVPPQQEVSYVDEHVYWRNADSTELATSAKQIAGIAGRFAAAA